VVIVLLALLRSLRVGPNGSGLGPFFVCLAAASVGFLVDLVAVEDERMQFRGKEKEEAAGVPV
jgi:hypothetical protein